MDHSALIDQLVDELTARSCALVTLVGCRPTSETALEQRARALLSEVLEGSINMRDVVRMLHPVSMPSTTDHWWQTPLGQLTLAADSRPQPIAITNAA